MNLFRSKFAKLEALVATKADERTPDQLQAAQAELDTAQAGVILVPKSEGITTGAELQQFIDKLQKDLQAEAERRAAVEKQMEALRNTRVLDHAHANSDKGTGGDAQGAQSAEAQETAKLQSRVKQMPHYQKLQSILNN